MRLEAHQVSRPVWNFGVGPPLCCCVDLVCSEAGGKLARAVSTGDGGTKRDEEKFSTGLYIILHVIPLYMQN